MSEGILWISSTAEHLGPGTGLMELGHHQAFPALSLLQLLVHIPTIRGSLQALHRLQLL